MRISVFVPVYNEEEIVKDNIEKIYDFLSKNYKDFELVVVDDSSKDSTPIKIRELLKNKKVKTKRFENGPSRRENLSVAMNDAKYDVVCFMDLDMSTPLKYLPLLSKKIEEGQDIAIGSRRLKNSRVKRSAYRSILSTLYHYTIRVLYGSKIKDYQCGFKLFKKDIFTKLSKKASYDKKFERGWFWDAEMLLFAEKYGYKIYEMPVDWIEGKKSTFNFFRELKTLGYILKLRFSNKYLNG